MKYRVTYLRTIAETYYVDAINEDEAEEKATIRELEEEPDEEVTTDVKIECEAEE